MDSRPHRRRLLKPRPVAWTVPQGESPPEVGAAQSSAVEVFGSGTDRPAPARVQLPAPGTSEPAVLLPPPDWDPPYDPTSVPGAPPREEFWPMPTVGLTLIPSFGVPGNSEPAIEAHEDDGADAHAATSWMSGVDAIEAGRSVPTGGESDRDGDAFPMEWETDDSPGSMGVRLGGHAPARRGLNPGEWALLALMGALTPLVIGGGLVLGWSFARATPRQPADLVVAAPLEREPLPTVELVESRELVPAPVPIEEAHTVPELRRPEPAPRPRPVAPHDPWTGPPAVVPAQPSPPAEAAPGAVEEAAEEAGEEAGEEAEEKKRKKKKNR